MNLPKIALLACAALTSAAGAALAANFSGSYTQNFDGMGASGTTLPAEFLLYKGEGGDNNTWNNTVGITPNGSTLSVASMVLTTGMLTANNSPTANNINGYNAAAPGDTTNRIAATAPTGVTGNALDLTLTNTTGAGLNALTLGYTIQRVTSVGTANELPGYNVFVSLDNATWTEVTAFHATIDGAGGTVAVPNTVGVTTVSPTTFTLSSAWAAGSNLHIRWVDDNAVQTSPDQIVGLDNVAVTLPVPEPSTWTVALLGLGALGVLARRRRAALGI